MPDNSSLPGRLSETRERYWRTKLRRLRFGVEPLAAQVERTRRSTVVLTGVALGVASMILAIFTAFRRPDLGFVFILILFTPMIGLAWLDYRTLKRRFQAYARECDAAADGSIKEPSREV